MPFAHRILALSLIALLGLTGCRSSAPLSGSWSNEVCFGSATTPSDIESCETTLVFTDALEMSLIAVWVSLPATAEYPGCITERQVTGQSWSTRARGELDVLNVEGSGTATIKRYGCVYTEDDSDATATTGISIPSGDITYQISDGVLSILSSDIQGTYAP